MLLEICNELAVRHQHVKFIKSIATSSVENFHDSHCPSTFLYKANELLH